jgi:CheY-like chemotaxis protein
MPTRILLVEDEPDNGEIISDMLTTHNYEVAFVVNAQQALSALATHDFAALIIDLALPGMNGFDLIRQVRLNDAFTQLPSIAITAYHAPTVRRDALSAGFNVYISKPVDETNLIAELQRLIGAA